MRNRSRREAAKQFVAERKKRPICAGDIVYRKGQPCTVVVIGHDTCPPHAVVRLEDGREVGVELDHLKRDPDKPWREPSPPKLAATAPAVVELAGGSIGVLSGAVEEPVGVESFPGSTPDSDSTASKSASDRRAALARLRQRRADRAREDATERDQALEAIFGEGSTGVQADSGPLSRPHASLQPSIPGRLAQSASTLNTRTLSQAPTAPGSPASLAQLPHVRPCNLVDATTCTSQKPLCALPQAAKQIFSEEDEVARKKEAEEARSKTGKGERQMPAGDEVARQKVAETETIKKRPEERAADEEARSTVAEHERRNKVHSKAAEEQATETVAEEEVRTDAAEEEEDEAARTKEAKQQSLQEASEETGSDKAVEEQARKKAAEAACGSAADEEARTKAAAEKQTPKNEAEEEVRKNAAEDDEDGESRKKAAQKEPLQKTSKKNAAEEEEDDDEEEEEEEKAEEEARTTGAEEEDQRNALHSKTAEEQARKNAGEEEVRKNATEEEEDEAARKKEAETESLQEVSEEKVHKKAVEEQARMNAAEAACEKAAGEDARTKAAAENQAPKNVPEEASRTNIVDDGDEKDAAVQVVDVELQPYATETACSNVSGAHAEDTLVLQASNKERNQYAETAICSDMSCAQSANGQGKRADDEQQTCDNNANGSNPSRAYSEEKLGEQPCPEVAYSKAVCTYSADTYSVDDQLQRLDEVKSGEEHPCAEAATCSKASFVLSENKQLSRADDERQSFAEGTNCSTLSLANSILEQDLLALSEQQPYLGITNRRELMHAHSVDDQVHLLAETQQPCGENTVCVERSLAHSNSDRAQTHDDKHQSCAQVATYSNRSLGHAGDETGLVLQLPTYQLAKPTACSNVSSAHSDDKQVKEVEHEQMWCNVSKKADCAEVLYAHSVDDQHQGLALKQHLCVEKTHSMMSHGYVGDERCQGVADEKRSCVGAMNCSNVSAHAQEASVIGDPSATHGEQLYFRIEEARRLLEQERVRIELQHTAERQRLQEERERLELERKAFETECLERRRGVEHQACCERSQQQVEAQTLIATQDCLRSPSPSLPPVDVLLCLDASYSMHAPISLAQTPSGEWDEDAWSCFGHHLRTRSEVCRLEPGGLRMLRVLSRALRGLSVETHFGGGDCDVIEDTATKSCVRCFPAGAEEVGKLWKRSLRRGSGASIWRQAVQIAESVRDRGLLSVVLVTGSEELTGSTDLEDAFRRLGIPVHVICLAAPQAAVLGRAVAASTGGACSSLALLDEESSDHELAAPSTSLLHLPRRSCSGDDFAAGEPKAAAEKARRRAAREAAAAQTLQREVRAHQARLRHVRERTAARQISAAYGRYRLRLCIRAVAEESRRAAKRAPVTAALQRRRAERRRIDEEAAARKIQAEWRARRVRLWCRRVDQAARRLQLWCRQRWRRERVLREAERLMARKLRQLSYRPHLQWRARRAPKCRPLKLSKRSAQEAKVLVCPFPW